MGIYESKSDTDLKLPHKVIVRAPGLLPMLYRTRELAKELGVNRTTIVRWSQRGAPHKRDPKGHIWIHGQLFASWVETHRRNRSRPKLPIDQGYCLRCNQIITIQDQETRRVGNMIMIGGTCPDCGAKVNRATSDDQ